MYVFVIYKASCVSFSNDVYVYITIGLSLYYECFILWAAEFIIFNFITYKLKLQITPVKLKTVGAYHAVININ